jgi:putative Mn2+ efflux pump MntP
LTQILIGSFLLSILHAVIPNHWLPILAIGKKEGWSTKEVTQVTLISASAHALSTVLLGLILSYLGAEMEDHIDEFTHLIAPSILILLGVVFIYRHHRHKHFHINENLKRKRSKIQIIMVLAVAMFFSPCMEIEGYFLLAGTHEGWLVWFIALMYFLITITGMALLVRYAYKGLLKINWHKLEHNTGIITGITLVITGIISFFIH